MRIFTLFFITLVCSLSIATPWYVSAQTTTEKTQSKTLTIVTGDYTPAIDHTLPDKGYVSRLVKDAFALAGIEVEFLFMPWARGLRTVRSGKEAVIMYYAKQPERLKYFTFSDPLFSEDWFFFHLKKTPFQWQTLEDLAQFRIGATLSYSYNEEFHDLADKNLLNVYWVARDEQNWQMLMAGRIDLFPSVIIGWHQLRKIYSERALDLITLHPKPFVTHKNYLLFSKEHPEAEYYRKQFNRGFTLLKQQKKLSDYIPDTDKNWPELD